MKCCTKWMSVDLTRFTPVITRVLTLTGERGRFDLSVSWRMAVSATDSTPLIVINSATIIKIIPSNPYLIPCITTLILTGICAVSDWYERCMASEDQTEIRKMKRSENLVTEAAGENSMHAHVKFASNLFDHPRDHTKVVLIDRGYSNTCWNEPYWKTECEKLWSSFRKMFSM